MYDINLPWGNDLTAGSSGDLALVDGSVKTEQRVVRRLLTNAGDYIWDLGYGGGVGLFVGSTANPSDIEAVIRTQISLEPAVPAIPAPSITVKSLDSLGGYVTADITYSDQSSDRLISLTFPAG